MSRSEQDIFHEIERSDETAVLKILKIIRLAQDFRSTDELFVKICDGIVDIYKAYYHVSIFLHTADRKDIEVAAIAGENAQEMRERFPTGYRQPVEVGIAGLVYRTRKIYLSNDISTDPHFVPAMSSRTKSELCIPIFDMRTCIGGLNIESDRIGTFTAIDFHLFEVLTHAIGSSITRDRQTKDVLDSIGALGALGAAYPGAILVLTPEGAVKYGNRRVLPYKGVEGLVPAILAAREGQTFEHRGRGPDGTEFTLSVHLKTNRGGFLLAEIQEKPASG